MSSMAVNPIPRRTRCWPSRLMCCCRRNRQPEALPPPPLPPPMTEEEKERFEYLENLLPCHIYRKAENDEETPYRLYDGFDDSAQDNPLSLRLQQQECSICLMEYEDGEKLTSSHNPKCPHAFHRECMQRWLISNSECPFCRKGFLEFGDDEDEANTGPIASRFALMTNSFQQRVGRVRQDIGNRLEPIIVRLEQQRAEIINPNANHRRTNRGGGDSTTQDATQYRHDDGTNDSNRPIRSSIQQRMGRIREGLSGQFDNMMIRLEQNRNAIRGDDHSAHPSGTRTSNGGDNSSRSQPSVDNNRQTTTATTTNEPIPENETQPDLFTATSRRVLEMGSARWKDVTRVVGQSFRGEPAAAALPQESSQTTTPEASNSSPAT
mmetsp:Transcript_25115/g.61924  ORF Transcript_25115/g.61924 Transcript_25115/m.61924 type:complete len:379 (+) Transcript_25115:397-1533(+)